MCQIFDREFLLSLSRDASFEYRRVLKRRLGHHDAVAARRLAAGVRLGQAANPTVGNHRYRDSRLYLGDSCPV